MRSSLEFKRGDSFHFSGALDITNSSGSRVVLTDWTGVCKVDDAEGRHIADVDVLFLDRTAQVIALSFPGSTAAWPLGEAQIDVQFIDASGFKQSSETTWFVIAEGPSGR